MDPKLKLKEESNRKIAEFKVSVLGYSQDGAGFFTKLKDNIAKSLDSGITKQEFFNGSYYEGSVNPKGMRMGQGMMYMFDNQQDARAHRGDIYFGGWVGDNMHGVGTYVYKDTFERFEGTLKAGKKDGKGQFLYANGDVYKGKWVDDNRAGQGEMTYATGTTYTGEWK